MNKYWEFKNKTPDEAELYLYTEIASWGGGGYAHSAKSFKRELDALGDIKTLNVYINSPGGDVFEGTAIYNMLARKKKKCQVNIYIDGLAASIASVIAMAGTKVYMPSNSMMMIHNAWCFTYGNAAELRKVAEDLDKINSSTVIQAYLNKAGDSLDKETLVKLLDDETWLSAQECLDYGLCDEITSAKNMAAKFDSTVFKNFKNVPEDIIEKLHQEEAEESNESEKAKLLMELDLI